MKKVFYAALLLVTSLTLVTCKKDDINVTLEVTENEVSIYEGETYKIVYEVSDEKGVIFSEYDEEIIEVSDEGLVTAKSYGEAKVTITSVGDSNVKKEVNFTIKEAKHMTLAEGMTEKLEYSESAGYSFDISNQYVLSVDEDGVLNAELSGDATVKVIKDEKLVDLIKVVVMNKARRIELTGPKEVYINEEVDYEAYVYPNSSYDKYEYIVEDESIFIIDKNGRLIPKGFGTTKLTLRSLQDDETKDELEITVKGVVLVDNKIKAKEEKKIGEWTFKEGVDLFNNLNDAIANVNEGEKLILQEGVYEDSIEINKSVYLQGEDAVIHADILLDAKDVTLSNFTFGKDSQITGTSKLNSFSFNDNTVKDVLTNDFIDIAGIQYANISNNTFKNLKENAISLRNINRKPQILIEKNEIDEVTNGIKLTANERIAIDSNVHLYRNKIKNTTNGFYIDFGGNNEITNAILYARFNQVTNYSNKAVLSVDKNKFEYTFNYWGDFDLDKFENVDESMLLAHYESTDDIITEGKYDSNTPLKVYLDNPQKEIQLGDEYTLEPISLPYSAKGDRVLVSVDDRTVSDLVNNRTLVPIKSGYINLTIGSYSRPEEAEVNKIKVTTDPGIHFDIDVLTQSLVIGDKFKIDAKPFPFDRAEEAVIYKSSDNSKATVDNNGNVEILGAGDFVITASFRDDELINEKLSFTSNESLDDKDLMDFFIKRQVSYSRMHEITLHGATLHDRIHSDSVTRIVDTEIFKGENIIPVTPGFRPGLGMNSDIPQKYKYNKENVVWVVVHDTGNTNVGAGAELHSNYLYNQATSGGRKASWHFTVDSHNMYQHLPTLERGYHAGDGSAKPKENLVKEAFGGENLNGIGIEMSVQRDGDVYKTWQNTARLVAELLVQYNLPLSQQTYHNDFSGKECPQSLRKSGLLPLFEEFVENEYNIIKNFGKIGENIESITINSHNPDIISSTGVVRTPNRSTTVSYDLIVKTKEKTYTKTFTTNIEGLWR